MTVDPAALLLAQIRAEGHAIADKPTAIILAAASAAAGVDRRLIEVAAGPDEVSTLVLGWDDGAGPDPDQYRSAQVRGLSSVPCLVWAVCLAAAWPDSTKDPLPGKVFSRDRVLQACVGLGVPHHSVVAAMDGTLLKSGLIMDAGTFRQLGLGAAALPGPTWSALRRVHDRLPHDALRNLGAPDNPQSGVGAVSQSRIPPVDRSEPIGVAETMVRAAVTALEFARGPVARADLPALSDPAIRRSVEDALIRCGRTVRSTADGRWTTGYLDDVAQALAARGHGTLTSRERAVLALILLRTVAIPRALGQHHHDSWEGADHPVSLEELGSYRNLSGSAISEAVRGLRAAGYVTTAASGGYLPGPALARLSQAGREGLWEDLVLLARPNGYLSERIRARRGDNHRD